MRPILPYRYWNRLRNCGDAITAYLLRDVVGVEPILVGAEVPHLLGTGSILFMHAPKSLYWGCGVMDPSMKFPAYPADRFFAVRGKLTYQWLRDLGVNLGDVPLGDPGMLVSRLGVAGGYLKNWALLPPLWRAAVIPHWTHVDLPKFLRYSGSSEIALVDMRDSSLKPLEIIARSEIVISESLHGLIFAEALGKPSLWIGRTDAKWTWKFRDWYSNLENAPLSPIPIEMFDESHFRLAEIRNILSSQDDLLQRFPAGQLRMSRQGVFLPFDQCRGRSPEMMVVNELSDTIERLPVANWINRARDQFADWAEPVYWGVVKHGNSRIAHLSSVLVDFLDHDRLFRVCCVAEKEQMKQFIEKDTKIEQFRGIDMVRGSSFCGSAAIFRDTSPFTISDENRKNITATLFI